MRKLAGVIAVLFGLQAGCGVLPKSETTRHFRLPGTAQALPAGETVIDRTLSVYTPRTSGLLSSARILVVPAGNEIRSYQGARWSEPVPGLLQDRIIDAFLADGRIASVTDEATRVASELALASRLSEFHAEYVDGVPVVRIVLDVRLIQDRRQRVPSARRFVATAQSRDERIESVVDAFGNAADEISRNIVAWTTQTIIDRSTAPTSPVSSAAGT